MYRKSENLYIATMTTGERSESGGFTCYVQSQKFGVIYMETETVVMPRELTAENGAKALLSGEFSVGDFIECGQCDNGDASMGLDYEECDFCDGQGGHHISIAVDWPTIKAIYAKAVKHLGT